MSDPVLEISSVTLPSGNTYNIKDAQARQDISNIETALTGAMHYIGISSTTITDGGTQNPTIDGTVKVMTAADAGAVCIYGDSEFVWSGSVWQEFGSTGSLKAMAFADTASGTISGTAKNVTVAAETIPVGDGGTYSGTNTYKPTGSVSVTVGTTSSTYQVTGMSGTPTYTPDGTVGTPTISLKTAGSTSTIHNPTKATVVTSATMPTYSVSNETLTITAGSVSTGDSITTSDVTVKTGDGAYESSQPSWTGSGTRLVTAYITIPTGSGSGSFTGDEVRLTGSFTQQTISYTPEGTVTVTPDTVTP